ncbi:MAG: glutathione synthetase [Pseudomonadota bacterium]|nr:glutathione synthetase [Pseudomonadota bacterium]
MLIAFFVNAMDDEYPRYTTTLLAYEASQRGHDVCYLTPGDFVMSPDDGMQVHARIVPAAKTKSRTGEAFFKDLQAVEKTKLIDITDIDVLMLRNDPSNDALERPWAEDAGIQFGRRAAQRGVLVLNDPGALSQAMNKLYFQSFPREVRAETLITRHADDIKKFAKKHGNKVVLKPLQGSGGQGVFLVDSKIAANLNQMIEAIGRDGYIIAQTYVPEADKGDIRLFLMNGVPLGVDGKYAAMRRVSSKDDIRSNIHAGGKAKAVKITERELRVAELIRPKLIKDGMFLVGIDIIGDTILEVNVFSPGNLHSCTDMTGINFAAMIIAAIERKVEIAAEFPGHFDNRTLAVM